MTSSKTLKHLRIVVHVNEEYSDDQNDRCNNSSFKCGGVKTGLKRNLREVIPPSPQPLNDNIEFDNMKAEILLIDDKSLQLNLISTEENGPYTNISHKMHFDNVAHSTTDMIERELAMVVDNILLKRKNSCIMRFANKQEIDVPIFFDLFIKFLHKRLQHQKYKLQYIKLECVDIAAGVQNSKNHTSETCFATRASVAHNSDDDCNGNEAVYKLSRNSEFQFRSIKDLLLWLVNEYRYKFSANKGHEKLQFSFSIVDHQQNIFNVKLSLFNIFLNFMNTEDLKHWHHYMDHMGEGCRGLDCKFVHSGLTLSLSNYIEGTANANTLLIFVVPTNIKMTATTIEMLQMAHSAIKNRKRNIFLLSTNVNLNRRLPPSSNISECLLNNSLASNPKKLCLSPLRHLRTRDSLGMSLYDGTYSSKDFNALSGWYQKVDECFEKNCQLRETYYGRYFKLKTKQISSNIKNMFKSLESLDMQQSERGDPNELQEDQIELLKLFDSYHDAQMQFRQISENTKGTEFEEILKIYLDTKTFNLNNQAFTLKRKYLELCKQHLNLAFDYLTSDVLLELEI